MGTLNYSLNQEMKLLRQNVEKTSSSGDKALAVSLRCIQTHSFQINTHPLHILRKEQSVLFPVKTQKLSSEKTLQSSYPISVFLCIILIDTSYFSNVTDERPHNIPDLMSAIQTVIGSGVTLVSVSPSSTLSVIYPRIVLLLLIIRSLIIFKVSLRNKFETILVCFKCAALFLLFLSTKKVPF